MINQELRHRVLHKVEECYHIAEQHFNRHFERCTVNFDLTGTCAGRAHYTANRIRLNPQMLINHESEFIDQTVPHEVAHLLAFQVYGSRIKPHGSHWKKTMLVLGVEPTRCHNYDLSKVDVRRKTKYHYACGCPNRNHIVSSVLHNRMIDGRVYRCTSCKTPLRMVQTIGQVDYQSAAVKAKDNNFVPPTNVATSAVKAPRSGSKLDQCYQWYSKYKHDRQMCIAVFIQEVGCTQNGAMTYWYKCKEMYNKGV